MIIFMMKLLKELIINILFNTIILYVVNEYFNQIWFNVISTNYNIITTFLILWIIFWFLNNILKKILKIVTIPLKIITLWLSSIIINILIFYVFEAVINNSNLWITINISSIVSVIILSIIITISYFLIRKFI